MAEVYWIHLPEHTDMFSEGYIGVTKNTAKDRYRLHCQHAERNQDKNYLIYNVINKYGSENLIVDTLVICTEDYAYDLEVKLRPDKKIGWNLAAGGVNAGNYSGYTLSDKTKKKMSEAKIAWHQENPDHAAALAKVNIGRKRKPFSEEWKRKRVETRFYQNFFLKPDTWGKAEVFYGEYLSGLSSYMTAMKYSLAPRSLVAMFTHFANGWNPEEDPKWADQQMIKEA